MNRARRALVTGVSGGATDGVARAGVGGRPRWYWHPYNRPPLYRLAGALDWLPRGARLALARTLARLAPPFMPHEEAAVRKTLGAVTGAPGAPPSIRPTLAAFRAFEKKSVPGPGSARVA